VKKLCAIAIDEELGGLRMGDSEGGEYSGKKESCHKVRQRAPRFENTIVQVI
jgi:hypothetical protein